MGISSIWKRLFKDYQTKQNGINHIDAWLDWRVKINEHRFTQEEIDQHVISNWTQIEAKLKNKNKVLIPKSSRVYYVWGSLAAAIVTGFILLAYFNQQRDANRFDPLWGQPAIAGGSLNTNQIKVDINSINPKKHKITQDSISEIYVSEGNLIFQPIKIVSNKNIVAKGFIQTPFQRTMKIDFSKEVSVRLNAGSILYYSLNTNFSDIHFKIQGEGYFNVKHHLKNNSLEVLANGHTIKDIGTQFNIENYNTNELNVSVRQGLVAIDQLDYLTKNEKYKFQNGKSPKLEIDERNLDFEWLDNKFKFKSITLQDLMTKISRWYNVTYTFTDNITSNQFTGSFPMNIPLSDVIKILNSTGKMNLTIKNKTILISKP